MALLDLAGGQRFADTYRLELSAWVLAAAGGRFDGPGARTGHRADLVTAAGVESLLSGRRVDVATD